MTSICRLLLWPGINWPEVATYKTFYDSLGRATDRGNVILFCTEVNALTTNLNLDVVDEVVANPVEPTELRARAVR